LKLKNIGDNFHSEESQMDVRLALSIDTLVKGAYFRSCRLLLNFGCGIMLKRKKSSGTFKWHSAVLGMRIWQTLHTEGLCPYRIWRTKHLEHVKMGRLLKYCPCFAAQPTTFYSLMRQFYPQCNQQYHKLTFVSS
jgi:hypothetical protein